MQSCMMQIRRVESQSGDHNLTMEKPSSLDSFRETRTAQAHDDGSILYFYCGTEGDIEDSRVSIEKGVDSRYRMTIENMLYCESSLEILEEILWLWWNED